MDIQFNLIIHVVKSQLASQPNEPLVVVVLLARGRRRRKERLLLGHIHHREIVGPGSVGIDVRE